MLSKSFDTITGSKMKKVTMSVTFCNKKAIIIPSILASQVNAV